MRFTHHSSHPLVPGVEAWKSSRGFWSFLVMHDKEPNKKYYTSYRDQRRREIGLTKETATTVMFYGNDEWRHVENVPPEYGYATIDDAIRACEAKYKQLVTEKS